jgi:hypothetical protein
MTGTATRAVAFAGAACLMVGTAAIGFAAPASASPRTHYLSEARSYDTHLKRVSSGTLWKVGKSTCRVLDAGGHFNDVLDVFSAVDLPADAQAAIVVSAIHNLCPGHEQFLNEWLAG